MRQAHRKAVRLCSSLERFIKRAPEHVLLQPRDTPLPPHQKRTAATRRRAR
jgi:hypothetical protein